MKYVYPITVLLLAVSVSLADDDLGEIESLLEGLPEEKPAEQVAPANLPGDDIGAPAEGTLAGIGQQMQQVKSRIDSGDTADETQFMQKQIVSDLDELLKILNKKCQGGQCNNPSSNPSSGSGKPKPGGNPGAKSNKPGAQGSEEGVRDAEDANETEAGSRTVVRQAWGHLPERLREQVQAAAFERFLPQYESLVEAYYERLAEEAE